MVAGVSSASRARIQSLVNPREKENGLLIEDETANPRWRMRLDLGGWDGKGHGQWLKDALRPFGGIEDSQVVAEFANELKPVG